MFHIAVTKVLSQPLQKSGDINLRVEWGDCLHQINHPTHLHHIWKCSGMRREALALAAVWPVWPTRFPLVLPHPFDYLWYFLGVYWANWPLTQIWDLKQSNFLAEDPFNMYSILKVYSKRPPSFSVARQQVDPGKVGGDAPSAQCSSFVAKLVQKLIDIFTACNELRWSSFDLCIIRIRLSLSQREEILNEGQNQIMYVF